MRDAARQRILDALAQSPAAAAATDWVVPGSGEGQALMQAAAQVRLAFMGSPSMLLPLLWWRNHE